MPQLWRPGIPHLFQGSRLEKPQNPAKLPRLAGENRCLVGKPNLYDPSPSRVVCSVLHEWLGVNPPSHSGLEDQRPGIM